MIALLAALAVQGTANLNLTCGGAAEVDQSTSTYSRYGIITTEGRASIDDTVAFKMDGAGSGTARVPRRMLPLVKTDNDNGWFPLIHVQVATDEITGQVRLNQYNKPRFRIDRISGTVRIDGPTGDFSGECRAYDPAAEERKF